MSFTINNDSLLNPDQTLDSPRRETINNDSLLRKRSAISPLHEDMILEVQPSWWHKLDIFNERVSMYISKSDKRYVRGNLTLCASFMYFFFIALLGYWILSSLGNITAVNMTQENFNLTNYWDYGN